MIRKILWIIIVISLIGAAPLIRDRYRAETSTKAVEAVIDYADILNVSTKVYNQYTEQEIVNKLREKGITTIAYYEQTLKDLSTRGILNVYNSSDDLVRRGGNLPYNQTLVVLNDKLSGPEQNYYQQMIINSFGKAVSPAVWNGKSAMLIHTPLGNVYDTIFLGADFNLIKQMQQKYGLHSIVRINSDRPWNEELFNWQFTHMKELGINKVVFEGKNVLGYPDHMQEVADWMKQDSISFGLIDFFDQNGYKQLGRINGFQTFRVLSVNASKVASDTPTTTADVFTLGIKERGVRMIYIHMPLNNSDQVSSKDILDKTTAILDIVRHDITPFGFVFKATHPFTLAVAKERGWQNVLVVLGMLSMVTLCLQRFHRMFLYLPIPLGLLLYVAGKMVHQETLIFELFALVGSITAPSYATMLVMDWVKKTERKKGAWLWAIVTFIFSSIISLYGAVVVVSLLNDMVFVLYLEQFRGVKALYFVPILLVVLYWLLTMLEGKGFLAHSVKILDFPIKVKHVVISVVAIGALGYFLSRSGNAATTLPFELQFRQFLNDYLGVRPRTKEIFLGHPFFMLASFLMLKYKKGAWLFIVGVIGQMSMVSTFTHIHTPLWISVQRTLNGMVIGILAGIVLILFCEWVRFFFTKGREAGSNG